MRGGAGRHIITGSPRSGKTTVVRALSSHCKVFEEPVSRVIKSHVLSLRESGVNIPTYSVSVQELFPQAEIFLERCLSVFLADYGESQQFNLSVFDRGLPDLVVLHELLDNPVTPNLVDLIKEHRYSQKVFVFDLLNKDLFGLHIKKRLPFRTYEEDQKIRDRIVEVYQQFGYDIAFVPFDTVENRKLFVLERINKGFNDM